jgi:hypothetical protein
VFPEYVFAPVMYSVPAPDFVSELPPPPLITPDNVAKSVVAVPLSNTVIVRAPPAKLIGFVTVTSDNAVVEFRYNCPVPFPIPPVPKLTCAFDPPKFTTNGELDAANPPLWFVPHCT